MRRFFKRILPERRTIQGHRHLRFLGRIIHDPGIFHLTRHSTAGGVATGLFYAFIPIPGQMILAGLTAIWFRVNLPLAVILVWITNPVTIPPILYAGYKTGSWILGRPYKPIDFNLSWQWLGEQFLEIWPSLVTGCLILGALAGISGYAAMRLVWRLHVVRQWEARKQKKLQGLEREKKKGQGRYESGL